MADSEVLGKLGAWQIRDFPEVLRKQIVAQAEMEDESVPEFVARNLLALRDAGWPKFPLVPNGAPGQTSIADKERVASMVVQVSQNVANMTPGIRAGILRVVRQAIAQVDNKPPARERKATESAKRLAAPADAAAPESEARDAAE